MKERKSDEFLLYYDDPFVVEQIYYIRIRDAALCGDNELAARLMKIRDIAIKIATFNKNKKKKQNKVKNQKEIEDIKEKQ